MLEPNLYFEVLKAAMRNGGDYADLFIEHKESCEIELESGKIENIATGLSYGFGLRVIYGENYVYTYGTDMSPGGLLELARTTADAIRYEQKGVLNRLVPIHEKRGIVAPLIMPGGVALDRKVEKLHEADAAARDYSSLINQVNVKYSDVHQRVTIANSEGRLVDDERVRTRLAVESFAEKGEKKESGFSAPGKSMGFEFFDHLSTADIARESARAATILLEADYAPTGKMPVVICNGFGGVILHEAVAHALESSGVANNASVFAGKLGEKIGNDCITAIDDGTIKDRWGSINYDDEGEPAIKNLLIENGVLKSYMIDKIDAIKMGMPATASGRRESYAFAPTSRMTNTYLAPGKHTAEEIIRSVDRGIYCKNFGGGIVTPATTEFSFSLTEAYLIEKGRLTKPLKGATVAGKGCDTLKEIDMVGDDLEFSDFSGLCGANSGYVPVNVGQPTIRVQGLVVGGRDDE